MVVHLLKSSRSSSELVVGRSFPEVFSASARRQWCCARCCRWRPLDGSCSPHWRTSFGLRWRWLLLSLISLSAMLWLLLLRCCDWAASSLVSWRSPDSVLVAKSVPWTSRCCRWARTSPARMPRCRRCCSSLPILVPWLNGGRDPARSKFGNFWSGKEKWQSSEPI